MDNIEKKEIAVSIIKSALSVVPYAGQALNEILFDYRGRIKQERLNRFTNLLSEFFIQNTDIDVEKMKTEDFSDLLELVLRKVVLTKSEEKLKRFRDVLTSNIKSELSLLENSELYLDLISNLSEREIEILQHHIFFDKEYEFKSDSLQALKQQLMKLNEKQKKEYQLHQKGYANDYDAENIEAVKIEDQIKQLATELKSLDRFREHSFYNLTEDDFLYHKQKLQSLGLLIDNGIGGIGVRSFQLMNITEFERIFYNSS